MAQQLLRVRPFADPGLALADSLGIFHTVNSSMRERFLRGWKKYTMSVFHSNGIPDWKKLMRILNKIGVDWKEKRLLSNL